MEVLTDIPFEPDLEALLAQVHIEAGSDDAAEFESLLNEARSVGRPKAVYAEAYIDERGDDSVTIAGTTFTSRILAANLAAAERTFPYIATCGKEFDDVELPAGDMLKEFWLDTIKATALSAGASYLDAHLDHRYALGKTSTMSPGSGDISTWPIEQQHELFSVLGDVDSLIGVELTDSFLMLPNKTVSGIRFPTQKDFRSCQVCHREQCQGRSAPFDEEIWQSLQGDSKAPKT